MDPLNTFKSLKAKEGARSTKLPNKIICPLSICSPWYSCSALSLAFNLQSFWLYGPSIYVYKSIPCIYFNVLIIIISFDLQLPSKTYSCYLFLLYSQYFQFIIYELESTYEYVCILTINWFLCSLCILGVKSVFTCCIDFF